MRRIRDIRPFFEGNLAVAETAQNIPDSGFLFAYTLLHVSTATVPGIDSVCRSKAHMK